MKTFALSAFIAAFALAGCDSGDHHDHDHDKPAVKKPAGPVDPVCGMATDPATAKFKSTSNGKEVGFCSETCKATFDKEPAKYAMGYCGCAKTMKDCNCGHCKGGAAPKEGCDCH